MIKLFTTILTVMTVLVAYGQMTYFVSTSGNNSNNGSEIMPWQTVQFGMDQLSPGDTLNITSGSYPEKLNLNVSGLAGQMITVRAYQDQNVIVDANAISDSDPVFYANNKSHYQIIGIHFTNCYHLSGAGFYVDGFGKNIKVLDCKFSNIAISTNVNEPVTNLTNQPVISFIGDHVSDSLSNILVSDCEIFDCRPGFSECLTISGNAADFTFRNNLIHNNANIAIDATGNYLVCSTPSLDQARRGLIAGNNCFNNISPYSSAAGIYVDGGKDIMVENNNCHHNGYGGEIGCEETGNSSGITFRNNLFYSNVSAGIAFGGYDISTGGFVKNCFVRNNTFFNNDTGGNGNGALILTQLQNCEITNNIFYLSSQNYLLSNDLNQQNLVMDYNLIYNSGGAAQITAYWNGSDVNGLSAIYSTLGIGANDSYGDPLFMAAANGDFHIGSISPAIDSGDPVYLPNASEFDLDGEARLNGLFVDCGVDEYYSTTGFIDMLSEENRFNVYPNPTSNKVHFSDEFIGMEYTIHSLIGELVQSGVIVNNSINVEQINNGLYLMIFRLKGAIYTTKICKE